MGGNAIAALDLGTSNCRMMVARPQADGGFRVVESLSRIVTLGERLASTGVLSEDAMARAAGAIGECATRFARHGVARIDAVATEACRRAANAPDFLDRVRRQTGVRIRVISAREEAELTVESCAALLRGGGRRALLFDIGGGSTELAWVRLSADDAPPAMIGTFSLPIGVTTLEEAWGEDAASPAGFERLASRVAAAIAPFEAVHRIGDEMRHGGVRLIGTSGTVTTLAGEALGLRRYRRLLVDGVTLPVADAVAASVSLRALGREGLASHPCVGADRSWLVLAGCAIFEAVRHTWPFEHLLVADRGLREGLLLRLLRGDGRAAPVPAIAHRVPAAAPTHHPDAPRP